MQRWASSYQRGSCRTQIETIWVTQHYYEPWSKFANNKREHLLKATVANHCAMLGCGGQNLLQLCCSVVSDSVKAQGCWYDLDPLVHNQTHLWKPSCHSLIHLLEFFFPCNVYLPIYSPWQVYYICNMAQVQDATLKSCPVIFFHSSKKYILSKELFQEPRICNPAKLRLMVLIISEWDITQQTCNI